MTNTQKLYRIGTLGV